MGPGRPGSVFVFLDGMANLSRSSLSTGSAGVPLGGTQWLTPLSGSQHSKASTLTHLPSGGPKKSPNFIFTTKMVFPKSLKFMNSGGELKEVFHKHRTSGSFSMFLSFLQHGDAVDSSILPANQQAKANGKGFPFMLARFHDFMISTA